MSNFVKILIKKTFKEIPVKKNTYFHLHLVDEIDKFHTEMRIDIKNNPGFINAESYWKTNENTIITFAEWENQQYWLQWYHSQKRNTILEKYSNIFKLTEEIDVLRKYRDYDVFLL